MKKQLTTVFLSLLLSTFAGAQHVGIGTTNPMAPLDVAGDALINGLTVGRGTGNLQDNTVFGFHGLVTNSTGTRNTGIGFENLHYNTTGSFNSTTGAFALYHNTTGSFNSAFGEDALNSNIDGIYNTGIGAAALYANTNGSYNAAIGSAALFSNTSGSLNIAIGVNAGQNNVSGSVNTFIGAFSKSIANDLNNATAIGGFALVGSNNSMVLGSINGVNGASADTKVGIGTTTPQARLDVAADILINGLTAGRGSGNVNGNSAFGDQALHSNTTGSENTAIGYAVLNLNTSGSLNTAVGSFAGPNNVNGYVNTFIGAHTKPAADNLNNATAIGGYALVGSSNSIVLGSISGVNGAMEDTKVGIGTTTPQARLDVAADILVNGLTVGRGAGNLPDNTVIGFHGLLSNSTGIRNTGIGFENLHYNTSGSYNATTGAYALYHNTTGWFNSAFGDNALTSNSSGIYNTATGNSALYFNTNGGYNTAIGNEALHSNTSGSLNTAIGSGAGYNSVNGYVNTFIGANTTTSSADLNNATAIGAYTLVGSSNSIVLGSINGVNGATADTKVGIGTTTPQARLDVAADILINGLTVGRGPGNFQDNTAIGIQCLAANSTGMRNTSIGYENMNYNTTGSYNVTMGAFALNNNTSGSFNNAIGDNALNANTNGAYNTAIGNDALHTNTSGSLNIAIGSYAGFNCTGYVNTFLGANARPAVDDLDNATAIGGYALVGSSNSIVLGSINGVNGATADTKVGIGTTTPTVALEVVGQFKASAWKTASMSSNGYAEMGGVLLQWGTSSYTSNATVTITFPKVFVNVYSVTATVDAVNNSGSGANVPVKVMNIGNNTFQIAGTASFSGDGASKVRWMAVGN